VTNPLNFPHDQDRLTERVMTDTAIPGGSRCNETSALLRTDAITIGAAVSRTKIASALAPTP
jgi:hypothetical protein